jgi:hypothetical protein
MEVVRTAGRGGAGCVGGGANEAPPTTSLLGDLLGGSLSDRQRMVTRFLILALRSDRFLCISLLGWWPPDPVGVAGSLVNCLSTRMGRGLSGTDEEGAAPARAPPGDPPPPGGGSGCGSC